MKINSRNRKKYALAAHIVLTVKYRKHLLIKYGEFVSFCFKKISKVYGFEIEESGIDKNHIHLLVSYKPNKSISDIIKQLKQISTYELWVAFEAELRKQFWNNKIFWSSGYYVSSVGEESEVIVKYVRNQGSAQPNP